MKMSIDKAIRFALLAPFVAGMIIYGGGKPGPGQRPSRFFFDDYLSDIGSYSTNDIVHVASVKSSLQIPDDTPMHVYAALMGTTNWTELLPSRTYADQPADWTLADATNYDYIVMLDWVPPAPVVTNDILTVNALAAKGSTPPGTTLHAVLPRVALKTTLNGYVADGLVAMWDGIEHGDDPLIWSDLTGNGWDATQRVANAGWRWDADCYTGTAQNGHGFRTPPALASVLRNNITSHTVEIVFRPSNISRQTLFGQYKDNPPGVNYEYSPHLAGGFRAYYNGAPDTQISAWKSGLIRMTCAVVCNGQNTLLYENGVKKASVAQPAAATAGTNKPYIIGGENERTNMSIVGELCAIRFYSRALTADEVRHNNEIDRIRFNLP